MESRLPYSSKDVQDCNRLFGTQRHNIDRVRGFRTLQQVQKRSMESFQQRRKKRQKHDYHSLPRPLRNKQETLARRAEGLLMIGSQAHDWKVYA